MPRLKRIKYEKLYLPQTGMRNQFPNLRGVLSRPIRFRLISQQYDEMVKATVAMKYGDATAYAILKRFNSDSVANPTYQALVELGKVEKTLFLCNYLPSASMKQEVCVRFFLPPEGHDGLNVVESFNGVNDFIRYGRGGKFATNNPLDMEISMLSLHLLQNSLSMINTLLLERTIEQKAMIEKLSQRDFAALNPLFCVRFCVAFFAPPERFLPPEGHGHVNPYGVFDINLLKASFLEAA